MTEVSDSSTRHGLRETATLVVILAFLMNLLSRGFGETFAVFLLPIESEMGWTRTTLAGIYAIYMGAHGLAGVVIGWFVDRVGLWQCIWLDHSWWLILYPWVLVRPWRRWRSA